eukprot:1573391-Alexandrium_andersonii.AAC.1
MFELPDAPLVVVRPFRLPWGEQPQWETAHVGIAAWVRSINNRLAPAREPRSTSRTAASSRATETSWSGTLSARRSSSATTQATS